MKRKIETWLPIFPGFYNTIFEGKPESTRDYCPEYVRESFEPEIDWTDYYQQSARKAVNAVESLLADYVVKIEFQQLRSPREYNFANDAIDVAILPKKTIIRDYIYANKEAYIQYLTRYKSCSGFISSYSYDFEDWKEYTNDFRDYSAKGHYLGSVLQFIAENEGIDQFALFDAMCDHDYSNLVTGDFSKATNLIPEVEQYARDNYQTLNPDIIPEQFEEHNESIDVPAIFKATIQGIDSQTLQLL